VVSIQAKVVRVGSFEGGLSVADWSTVESRVLGVVRNLSKLEQALEAAANAAPWIARFKAQSEFGLPLGSTKPAELVALNRYFRSDQIILRYSE
jgi:hypothetical protein